MKIVDYRMSRSVSFNEFIEYVNEGIQAGWQPFGSPIIDGSYFCQAMVKYEEEAK